MQTYLNSLRKSFTQSHDEIVASLWQNHGRNPVQAGKLNPANFQQTSRCPAKSQPVQIFNSAAVQQSHSGNNFHSNQPVAPAFVQLAPHDLFPPFWVLVNLIIICNAKLLHTIILLFFLGYQFLRHYQSQTIALQFPISSLILSFLVGLST